MDSSVLIGLILQEDDALFMKNSQKGKSCWSVFLSGNRMFPRLCPTSPQRGSV